MTENQKLREALQAISHIDDATSHTADASAALDRIGQIARQAIALPTAAPVGELPELPEPFALSVSVHEGDTPAKTYVECQLFQKHPNEKQKLYTADQMRAYARAALAGDAVDAQRYRWLREQESDDFEFAVVKNPHFDVYQSGKDLDSAIDAAMRKDKP